MPVSMLLACAGLAIETGAEVAVTFTIDLTRDVRAISPLIYGTNTDELTAAEGIAFRRSGGNRLTGYNWENNASHAGTDWQNSSDNLMGGGNTPGKSMMDFQDQAAASGAATIITLPAAGYVSKDKQGTVSEAETAPSARWAKVVFEKGKPFTATPDTTDGEVYTDEFVDLMVRKYGTAATAKGVKFYSVDNEPALWPSTHPRIHPAQPTCVEVAEKNAAVAIAVKKIDPAAQIFGGVFYGYAEYQDFQGAKDWGTVNPNGKYAWYIDYFLDEMKKASDKAGKRLIDVLDIHWYPEATGDKRITDAGATSEKDRVARLQAPRSLWDSTYVESSWISQWATPKGSNPGPVNLLPRILASIDKYNPGTRLAITEYNYGLGDQISGGLAQADFLGVLGKTGVFAAAFWPLSDKPVYVMAAFRLFRNYDGKGGAFGGISARALSSDNENASIFASFNSGGDELHLIAINKHGTETVKGTFNVTSPVPLAQGKVYGLDKSGVAIAEKDAVGTITGNAFTYVLPAMSASHFIIKTNGALPSSIRAPRAAYRNGSGVHAVPAYLPDGRRVPPAAGKAVGRAMLPVYPR